MRRTRCVAILCMALVTSLAFAAPKVLRVLTHSSFAASKGLIEDFQKANDVVIQFSAGGDAGETLNKAILSKGSPLADVLYGVDNTFMGRALEADIFAPYDSPALAEIPKELQLDVSHRLLPVDFGFVSLNYDSAWFKQKNIPLPRTLEDLARPLYRGLLVVENPATSSPGLAFFLATISRFGENARNTAPQGGTYTWETYWNDLKKNDVLAVNGWEEAYYNEFSAQGKGKRPLVVSYSTSPAYEVYAAADPKPAEPPTGNIMPAAGTFRQVEFVGILKGAREEVLARKFVDFMLSPVFQADIPLQMWVYPSRRGVTLPDIFQRLAPLPEKPATIDAAIIDQKRSSWIQGWTQIVLH
jgi:thiamine transport system substrate-binding protein